MIRECHKCKSLFVANPPSPAELQSYYPPHYVAYTERVESTIRRVMGRLQTALFQAKNDVPPKTWAATVMRALPLAGYTRGYVMVPQGNHLDVGCGAGQFLEISRSLGMSPYGVEPNLAASQAAQAKGLNVLCGTLEDGRFPDRYFDLITMNHVFEHVNDPRATLIEACRILRLGGTLIITTPNAKSLIRLLFGKYWFQLDAPRHLQIYTFGSIVWLAQQARLEITNVHWVGHPVALTASLYNLLCPHGTHTPRTFLHRLLVGPPVQWLALPLTAIVNAFRLGDTIEVRMTSRAGQTARTAEEG